MAIEKVVVDAGPIIHLDEIDCLHLLSDFNEIILTDDAAARVAAKSIGIRTHGTIGILLRAIRRNFLTPKEAVNHLINIPDKSTLFIKKDILEKIIAEVKNEYNL